jgi:hypothetical protein
MMDQSLEIGDKRIFRWDEMFVVSSEKYQLELDYDSNRVKHKSRTPFVEYREAVVGGRAA